MMKVLRWELRQRRTALFWWSLSSILLAIFILALYPSIRDQAHQLNQVINQLPQGLRELKTGGTNSVDVADPVAFLNSQLFYATLPILWIILSITRGGSVLGKDEQNHTLELQLARPITRTSLLAAKGLSLVAELVLVGGLTTLAIALLAPSFSLHIGSIHLLLAGIYTVAFSLSFGLIAFALQAASSLTRRGATALAVLISFGGYLIASMSGLTHWLIAPARFAPFHYFTPDKIMRGQTVTGLNVYLGATLLITMVIALVGFRRRDIS